jgi:hypothetical protein
MLLSFLCFFVAHPSLKLRTSQLSLFIRFYLLYLISCFIFLLKYCNIIYLHIVASSIRPGQRFSTKNFSRESLIRHDPRNADGIGCVCWFKCYAFCSWRFVLENIGCKGVTPILTYLLKWLIFFRVWSGPVAFFGEGPNWRLLWISQAESGRAGEINVTVTSYYRHVGSMM